MYVRVRVFVRVRVRVCARVCVCVCVCDSALKRVQMIQSHCPATQLTMSSTFPSSALVTVAGASSPAAHRAQARHLASA